MATIQEGLIVVFLLTVNILPLVIRSRSWMVVHRRAANIAVMNLVPLWTGLTFGLPAHLLGVKWSTVSWMHRWIGRAVIIHSILHGAIMIRSDDKPVQEIRQHYVPFMAACAIVLIFPVTLHAITRRHPQLAMKCHYLLGSTALASLSFHVWMYRSKCLWYLVAAVAIWTALTATALVRALMRRWRRSWPSVVISPCHELLHIDITVPSRWKVEAGQYVYIWLPHAGLRAASQLFLIYISSWDDTPGLGDSGALAPQLLHLSDQRETSAQDDASGHPTDQEDTWSEAGTLVDDNTSVYGAKRRKGRRHAEPLEDHDAAACTASKGEPLGGASALTDATSRRTLHVLARPQSSPLNATLYQAKSLHNVRQNALVLGPYGRPPDLTRFGIVLLVVEDIGIARVFSLIQELVLASEQHRAMVRKLIVVWQMEDLDNRRWVNMQHLLDLDRQEFKILQFFLYYRQNRKNESSRSPGSRVRFNRGSVDVEKTISEHLCMRRGSMMVGVCARQTIRDQVRAIVQPKMTDELRLMDIDVEPYHRWLDMGPVRDTAGASNHLKWVNSRIAEGRG